MAPFETRWSRARRYGFGQSLRARIAYRLHDQHLRSEESSLDIGRLLGFGQHPTVLPTARPGDTPGWELEVLQEGTTFTPARPRIWADDGAGARELPVPSLPPAQTLGVRRLRVRDATIQPGQSLVVTRAAALVPELLDRIALGDGRYVPGPSTCVSPWRNRGDADPVHSQIEQRMRAQTATLWRHADASLRIARAISLFETVDDHFGHGMLDLLHRLRAIDDLPLEWPVLVSERMPANIVGWIRLIAPGRPILRCPRDRVIGVDHLVVPLENARLWQDPSCVGEPGTVPATIDPAAMRWLQGIGAAQAPHRDRRLWIRRDRSPHSRIRDERRLVDIAQSCGFEAVYLEELTLSEVRTLVSRASHVIAPMASAVANLVAAPPGVRVLQLTDEVTWLDRYGSLTWLETVGHESALLVGQNSAEGYAISNGALQQAIAWLVVPSVAAMMEQSSPKRPE